jgi:hypothetical protein
MRCEHGFKKDADGCDICQCAEPPPVDCSRRPMCMMFCPNGFKKGPDGCDICQCAEERRQPDSCPRSTCRKHCEHGFKKDANGCNICECEQGQAADRRLEVDVAVADARQDNICTLPIVVGPCRASLTRWHYDTATRRCNTFQYGGCRGNANNFRSEERCQRFCTPQVNRDRDEQRRRHQRVLSATLV